MNKTLLYILILLLIGWIILGAFLCCRFLGGIGCGDEDNTKEQTSYLWSLADGNSFRSGANDHFDFINSGYNYLPIGASLAALVDTSASYLRGHSDRSLVITGHYDDDETNNSILPTLGLARANQLKQLFVNKGVDSKQIRLADMLVDSTMAEGDTLFRGIALGFEDFTVADEDRIPRLRDELVGKPITLYFPTGEQRVVLSAEQRSTFSDIIYYLDNVSESNLSVSGHTDNSGSEAGNIRLSRKRAEFVMEYLIANGINGARLSAKGLGPNSPVASNDTAEGKAQNRRVEVVLN